ncbi:hypothetical protein BU26DRAFT_446336 [Trematosphaeria pertusa]|uniref:Thioesterase domain-containing protein n=1 Tax=Trematosphaeria pertusa TaxID=390896 RepID=A0A6A6J6G4_9PLEO|nr:uncharacterized protein BU26DRAFT_446336 [Trematosphaeria pertusa]KAF2257083.1 hypothetical protein BU26DRAFT_446336 [Trematosphaeria pertusa]
MTAQADHIETFAPIKWATPYLTSPNWRIRTRTRGTRSGEDSDRFCRDTMSSYDGVQHWLELYEKPAPGSTTITKSVSLCKFGPGLTGFPLICHGGAIMTIMDEALAFAMVASEAVTAGLEVADWAEIIAQDWRDGGLAKEGRATEEALKGYLVTAKLDMKFMKPVLCPGIVGVEVEMLENKGHKMKMRGVMKDGEGTPLLQADGLWVRLGGAVKL